MEDNSERFNEATGLLNFSAYEQAINMFRLDIDEDPLRHASYHNMALAQLHLGISKKDATLLKTSIKNFEKAIEIANEKKLNNGYPIAEVNLNWAKSELQKLK